MAGSGNLHGVSELEEKHNGQNRFILVLLFSWELERSRSKWGGIVLLQEKIQDSGVNSGSS